MRVGLEKCALALNSQPLGTVYVVIYHRHNYRLFKPADTTVVTMKDRVYTKEWCGFKS